MGEVTPKAESCDGKDNDCDGVVDDKTVSTTSCSFNRDCALRGAGYICHSGTGKCYLPLNKGCYTCGGTGAGTGICKEGITYCSSGSYGSCVGEVCPTAEICNNKDDDCDGQVDESLTQSCYPCSGSAGVGLCANGTQTCSAGNWGSCVGYTCPTSETCNNKDDDCDGQVDEGLVKSCYTGTAGTSGVGECKSGTSTCGGGVWGSCLGEVTPKGESCDGKDNDCDGVVDDKAVSTTTCSFNRDCALRGAGYICHSGTGKCYLPLNKGCYTCGGTAGTGICKEGITYCISGTYGSCQGQVCPTTESCNNKDDDCDGNIDDGVTQSCYTCTSGTAGVGICANGTQTCSSGNWGTCSGQVCPKTESCNNQDDDCDNVVDEKVNTTRTCTFNRDCYILGSNYRCSSTTKRCYLPVYTSCYTCSTGTPGVGICTSGTKYCSSGSWGSCSTHQCPRAETCNGIDDDCNGVADDSKVSTKTCRSDLDCAKLGLSYKCATEGVCYIPLSCGRLSLDLALLSADSTMEDGQGFGTSGFDPGTGAYSLGRSSESCKAGGALIVTPGGAGRILSSWSCDRSNGHFQVFLRDDKGKATKAPLTVVAPTRIAGEVWAVVQAGGAVSSSFGAPDVSRVGTGIYRIDHQRCGSVVALLATPIESGTPTFAATRAESGSCWVYTYDRAGRPKDVGFSFWIVSDRRAWAVVDERGAVLGQAAPQARPVDIVRSSQGGITTYRLGFPHWQVKAGVLLSPTKTVPPGIATLNSRSATTFIVGGWTIADQGWAPGGFTVVVLP